MCGVAGLIGSDTKEQMCQKMLSVLMHRGPDGHDVWCDEQYKVALGHTRLSIQDLTEAGRQPMTSFCGRYLLSYNGEIYNASAIRNQLQFKNYRGHSDTEVILASISERGLEATLSDLIGMFAFILLDREQKKISLVRDRIGIKPLYYAKYQNGYAFASQMNAFSELAYFNKDFNSDALAFYLNQHCFPAPQTALKNVYQVMPGEVVTFNLETMELVERKSYWQLQDFTEQQKQFAHREEARLFFKDLISDAVRCRLVSDVPLGAFLSGGYDSTLVAALMQQHTSDKIKTFSIGFDVDGFNEAPHAKRVAEHLGTEHHEFYLTEQDALNVIPHLASIYDEPFADASQIPTYLVSKMAKEFVTVCLSGDGGDELFAGYDKYRNIAQLHRRLKFVPSVLGKILHLCQLFRWFLPKQLASKIRPDNIEKMLNLLSDKSLQHIFQVMNTLCPGQDHLFHTAVYDLTRTDLLDAIQQMQYWDILNYLPNDILTKVDRASMAVSLEARVPLLDHRIVESIFRVPSSWNVQGNQGKLLLKSIVHDFVPQEIMQRPKMGFSVPIARWLRGALKPWASDLLNQKDRLKDFALHVPTIERYWQMHQQEQHDYHQELWAILMLLSFDFKSNDNRP